MLPAQGLFPDRQRTHVKGLGVGITTTLVQVDAGLVEQPRTLGKFEARLADQFRAGLRMGKKPFAEGPGWKFDIRKRYVNDTHCAFRPRVLRALVHPLLQHSLYQSVDQGFWRSDLGAAANI